MSDPVMQWAGYAQQAGKKYGIPPAVLLGLIKVESGGNPRATSSAGARGLTQFMPGTAPTYGVNVNPGGERSQVEGAAKYLAALGFAKNPTHALNQYNGAQTIGGKPNVYAPNVLAAAKGYDGASGGGPSLLDKLTAPIGDVLHGDFGAGPGITALRKDAGSAATNAASDALNSLWGDVGASALRGLLYVLFVLGGLALSYTGVKRLTSQGAPA